MSARNMKLMFLSGMLVLFGSMAYAEEEYGRTLEEVVVTATRTPQVLMEAPQQIVVVNRDDLDAAGGKVEEALDRLPSVRVNRTGSGFMAVLPTIRGSQPGEVLVLMDGHRLNSQQSGWFNLSDLPIAGSNIERIEILEDTSSALYGAEAIGGVINIITRDPADISPAGFRLFSGSNSSSGAEFNFSRPLAGGGLTALVGREITGGFRPNSDAEQNRLNIHASFPGEKYFVSFTADFLRKELGSPGMEQFPTPLARQFDDTNIFGVKYEYLPAERITITADAFWNRYRREYEDPDFGQHSRHVTHTGGLSVQGVLEGSPTGMWMIGAEGIRDDVDSTNDGSRHLTRQGIFLQDEVDLGGGWKTVLTGRYDHYSLFEDQISPRAALVFKPRESFSLKGSVARGYRTPTFDDLFWEDPFARGNPDLKPEKSWNYELAAGGAFKGFDWNTGLFRRDVKNLINWQDRDGDWVFTPENISSARISGLSAGFNLSPAGRGLISFGYTYINPEDRDRNRAIEGRPRHLFKTGLRIPSRWLDTGLYVSWIDRYPADNIDNESYWTSSLRLNRYISIHGSGKMELSLTVDNLFDEKYEVVPGFPAPEREFNFQIAWEY